MRKKEAPKKQYKVVWEDENDPHKTFTDKKAQKPVQEAKKAGKPVLQGATPKESSKAVHQNEHSLAYVFGVLGFMVLVWLFFYDPIYMIIGVAAVALLFGIYLHRKKREKAYIRSMEVQQVVVTIAHPFKTGFEFAMGIGIFGMICLIIGIVIIALFFGSMAYLVYNSLSDFLPFIN